MQKSDFHHHMNGNSMYPAICDQDQIEVNYFYSPKSRDELANGQIVLVREGEQWVVHRIAKSKNKVRLKGDWSPVFDETQWVWGEVKKINSKESRLVRDPILAMASRFVEKGKNPLVRKFFRLFILSYVSFVQWWERP